MGIFPFINPETVELAEVNKALPLFQEYAYDFANNCLLMKNGQTYLVSGNEALKIWIFKALQTDRYYHAAYSWAYGTEARTLFGNTINKDVLFMELRRFTVEALMGCPYIQELKNFNFLGDADKISMSFDCETIYGDLSNLEFVWEGA